MEDLTKQFSSLNISATRSQKEIDDLCFRMSKLSLNDPTQHLRELLDLANIDREHEYLPDETTIHRVVRIFTNCAATLYITNYGKVWWCLCWLAVTHMGNIQYGHDNKLTPEKIAEIKSLNINTDKWTVEYFRNHYLYIGHPDWLTSLSGSADQRQSVVIDG